MEDEKIVALINTYGDAHRSFAQFMVKHRFLEIDNVVKTFLEFCAVIGEEVGDKNMKPSINKRYLNKLLEKMNESLSKLGYRLVIVADETKKNAEYISFITERNYHLSFIPISGFSSDEIALFRMWLKLMFSAEEERDERAESHDDDSDVERPHVRHSTGEVPINKALNDSKTQGATLSAAQKVLNKLEQGKWIILEDDTMRLHPCAVAELEQILQREYDLPSCEHCKHPIVIGRLSYRCECDSVYHVCCLKKEKLPFKCRGNECDVSITDENLENFNFEDE